MRLHLRSEFIKDWHYLSCFGALTGAATFSLTWFGDWIRIFFFSKILMKQGKNPDADGKFDNSLNWNWNDDKLHFDNNWANNANHNFGSASGRFALCLSLRAHKLSAEAESLCLPDGL